MKATNLPAQYIPFQKIRVGSNTLEHVTALLTVNGNIPLLFGDGEPPTVWLSIPANKEGTEWYPLIKDNFSSHPDVVVDFAKKRVTIRTPQGTVLNAVKNTEGSLVIWKLDLRPFGLNIYTDEGALIVMGNRLSNNHFNGLQSVIAIGTP